jgi:hypothetical protein
MEVTEQGGRKTFRLAYAKYETAEVQIPTSEDALETFTAWVKTNGRYPHDITVDLDEANLIYLRDAEVPGAEADDRPDAELEPYERWERQRRHARAYDAYLVRALCILVQNLTEDVAGKLDTEEITGLLAGLGFFDAPAATEAGEGERPLPSTGATPTRSSRASTPATTASSRDG